MKICVDFTRLIPKEGNSYHGGGYYAYQIINGLIDYPLDNLSVSILWPKGYRPKIDADIDLFKKCDANIQTSDMWGEDFSDFDVLFLPLIDPWNFEKLKKIKSKFSHLKVVATLHDLRIADILKYDEYNAYYFAYGKMEYLIHLFSRFNRWIKCKKGLKSCGATDLLITDSNYSMQRIMKYGDFRHMVYYYLNVTYDNPPQYTKDYDKFILFVSANREEKNFARSLCAYLNAIHAGKTSLPLFVTGNPKTIRLIIDRLGIEAKEVEEHIRILGYVEDDEMQKLYANCAFLLYTSKSEGFGLPALQTGIYGRPVIAASTTSVPEVLGSTAYYVNPYRIDEIEEGIVRMSQRQFREKYEKRAKEYIPVLKLQMQIGQRRTVEDIISLGNRL